METLTPSDIKLFGFEYMYVWNEFKITHPSIVFEIEKSTIDEFGELAITKQHIVNKCRRIMIDSEIDLKHYNASVIDNHKKEIEKNKKVKESKYDLKFINALQKEIDELQMENKKLKEQLVEKDEIILKLRKI